MRSVLARAALVLSMIALALAVPVGALAGTTVHHVTTAGEAWNPCTNELMWVEAKSTWFLEEGGQYHATQVGTAVGMTTGNTYRFNFSQSRHEQATKPDEHVAVSFTTNQSVIGRGSIPNLTIHAVYVVVITNGEVKRDLASYRFSCQ